MNYEAASIIFFDIFVIFVTLCEVGSKFAENLARPAVETEQAASGRPIAPVRRAYPRSIIRPVGITGFLFMTLHEGPFSVHKKPYRTGGRQEKSRPFLANLAVMSGTHSGT